tara:strand:- start:377 stop:517 length:141 start_codon:yes stop_codon:yes gene_type:complete
MVNYSERIEEHRKRLKLIEQEYLMTIGKIKELEEIQKESEEKKEGK